MHHHALLVRQDISAEAARMLSPVAADEAEVFVVPDTEIGINEVRSLTIEASRRPREATRRLLIVTVSSLTSEAQQALLKLLEEPPVTTSFLFVIPPEISLLPTLTSRFFTIEVTPQSKELISPDFVSFAQSSVAERLEEISKRMTKKDAEWVEAMKTGLKMHLASATVKAEMQALGFVLSHINTRGASNKLLLEELALTLPSSRPLA